MPAKNSRIFSRSKRGAISRRNRCSREGINLQFCWLMVNYDIPWNPARLEQRMGRIHRYKQTHTVVLLNLVAKDTREGRVLKVLLEKMQKMREELMTIRCLMSLDNSSVKSL